MLNATPNSKSNVTSVDNSSVKHSNKPCRITANLLSFFHQLPCQPIIVAYSGGVDSKVLLHALTHLKEQAELPHSLSACHVNHGLSNSANLWAESAKLFCQHINVNIHVAHVEVDTNAKESLEALARDARYNALINVYEESAYIATAHHSDDQSETFLLALKRGAGIKGLSSMAVSTPLKQHTLVRPLLNVSRQDILDYAHCHQLTWDEDESNQDQRFDRNFLRQNIIPQLAHRWPSISTTINRSAEHCREAQALLDEVAAEDLEKCSSPSGALVVSSLLSLSVSRFNNCMRYFLMSQQQLMPSTQQLKQLHVQLSADSDKNPAIKMHQYWLRRYKGCLYLTADLADVSKWVEKFNASEHPASCSADVSGVQKNTMILPDDIGVVELYINEVNDCVDIYYKANHFSKTYIQAKNHHYQLANLSVSQNFTIKFSHYNPLCLPDYRQKSRPLKKVLQELDIPTWERKRIPLLYCDEQLVAALGHFVCKPFQGSKAQ